MDGAPESRCRNQPWEADPAGPVEDRMFKEALRTIYSRDETSYHARIAFHR